MDMNFEQQFNSSNSKVNIFDSSQLKVGKNALGNRSPFINIKVDYEWQNGGFESYKLLKCQI